MAGINDLDELQKHSDEKGFRSFSAELSFVPLFNLALQQNALPVAHELKLLNHTPQMIENLECLISSEPEFIHEKKIFVRKHFDLRQLLFCF